MSLGMKVGVLAALFAGALILFGCLSTSQGSIDWHIENKSEAEDVAS